MLSKRGTLLTMMTFPALLSKDFSGQYRKIYSQDLLGNLARKLSFPCHGRYIRKYRESKLLQ
jgi:hypothetical protein